MAQKFSLKELVDILSAPSGQDIESLYSASDRVRAQWVGQQVHLRGLVEFANVCRCNCLYCGLRRDNRGVHRYRMSDREILDSARFAHRNGYGTVVLQSGEDPELDVARIARLTGSIKSELGLAVTFSLGELAEKDYAALKDAGADRYLLKHETTNRDLFRWLKPDSGFDSRLGCLLVLRKLGYQIGSGCMVGLPGQSFEDLARDLLLLQELDIDMAGIGPFIPADGTPLYKDKKTWPADLRVETTLRMIALLRLMCPCAMIPVTTATITLDPEARRKGLQAGANVIMPNVGGVSYRAHYSIYPGKACSAEVPGEFQRELLDTIQRIGRKPGEGPGHCKSYVEELPRSPASQSRRGSTACSAGENEETR